MAFSSSVPTAGTKRSRIRGMVLTALFAALIAVCAQIVIPAGPIPFTLQTLGVFLAAGLLGTGKGEAAVGVYILLGAAGVPVFSSFKGGVGVLLGPTGGYIVGFLFTVLAVGLFVKVLGEKWWVYALGMTVGLALCYAFGTAWFVFSKNAAGGQMDVAAALGLCVIPFLLPDAGKIAVAVLLTQRLKKWVR